MSDRKKNLFRILFPATILLFIYNLQVASQDNKISIDDNKLITPGEIIKDSMFGFEMVVIPAGKITRNSNYLRRHKTTSYIEGFYIGKYEVTQKLWKEIMGNFPIDFNPEKYSYIKQSMEEKEFIRRKEIATAKFINDSLPVVGVSWEVIQLFLQKLSEKTGHSYRLPTDEEWEYAYRAGTESEYYFGNDTLLLDKYEWYNENSDKKIHRGGQKLPNPWGLYDIGGNVAEWTETIADLTPYARKHSRRFCLGSRRIYRGSHYLHSKFAANSTWTHAYLEVFPHEAVGFRIVREIKQ